MFGIIKRSCSICEEIYYAKGFCYKHYNLSDRKKEIRKIYNKSIKGKESRKKYYKTTKGKEARTRYDKSVKGKEAKRKYIKSDKGKASRQTKIYKSHQQNLISRYVYDFLRKYNANLAWQKTGIEEMSEIFATVTCNLKGKKACDLQEKILIKFNKNVEQKRKEGVVREWKRKEGVVCEKS